MCAVRYTARAICITGLQVRVQYRVRFKRDCLDAGDDQRPGNCLDNHSFHATLFALPVCDNGFCHVLHTFFVGTQPEYMSTDQYDLRMNPFLLIMCVSIAIGVWMPRIKSSPPHEPISIFFPPHKRKIPRRLLMTETTSRDPLIFFQRMVAPVIHIRVS